MATEDPTAATRATGDGGADGDAVGVGSPPVVDGRDREELLATVERIAPDYTDRWRPGTGDVGDALVALFADLAAGVTGRVDRLPEKHLVAFLAALGFDRAPPQAGRLPLSIQVSPGADRPVRVPAGTQAVAEATETRPELTFEIEPDEGFEATPAALTAVYSVDPDTDQVFDHGPLVPPADLAVVADREPEDHALFVGPDRQRHALYVGHADLLAVTEGTTLTVELASDAATAVWRDALVWEYYGEERDADGAAVVGWHTLSPTGGTAVPTTPTATPTPASVVETLLEDLDPTLRAAGFEPASLTPEARTALVASVATDRVVRDQSVPDHLLPAGVADPDLTAAIGAAFDGAAWPAQPAHLGSSGGTVTLTFEVGGTPTEWTVGGVTSRWLRARIPRGRPAAPLATLSIAGVSLGASGGPTGKRPDALLWNDVPLPTEGEQAGAVTAFGPFPQRLDTFYVASAEAFSKHGEVVGVTLAPTDASFGGDPDVSWEYWDGDGWSLLEWADGAGGAPGTDDAAATLTGGGTVRFRVPDDLEPTTVAGRTNRWIRARLIGGGYGGVQFEPDDATNPSFWTRKVVVTPPAYDGVRIEFGDGATTPPQHAHRENGLSIEPLPAPIETPVSPFQLPTEAGQTLYLGFDGPVRGGPIHLFYAATDRAVPEGFTPRVRWEGATSGAADEWTALRVRDGSEGLTERGVVRLTVPGSTARTERFGQSRHWLRARVAGDPFVGTLYVPTAAALADDLGADVRARPGAGQETDGHAGARPTPTALPACGTTVTTLPPAGVPAPSPPAATGLYPNTGWAANVRSVADERLGSSDGRPGQSFALADAPVVDATVWVDERAALTAAERTALREADPDAVETVSDDETDAAETLRRVWVRWRRVDDFLDSGSDDRHYVLDRLSGVVTFGDGIAGAVPPVGRTNVRADYRTGGGEAGNVPAGAVASLVSSLPFVEGVVNPEAADGGADAEPTPRVLERGPATLRDRDRAVTPADLERVARAGSRRLARVRCLPGLDRAGRTRSGWVTLLVVPRSGRARPDPSVELRRGVHEYVAARAAATLVDPDRLVVRGPSYVAATVETTLVTRTGVSVTAVETAADDALAAYLHPLTGGPDGAGWPFGELPCRADLYALLESLPDVDHVADLTLRFRGAGEWVTATEGDDPPSVAVDALVYAGPREVAAVGPAVGAGPRDGGTPTGGEP